MPRLKDCPKCHRSLLSIYYRDNSEDSRKWVRIEGIAYCPECGEIRKP